MIRLGLCCAFRDQPIQFRTTTAAATLRLVPSERLERIADIIRANAKALYEAIRFCAEHGIGCFRVNSQILPLRTHPVLGYAVQGLPRADEVVAAFRACGHFAARNRVRLTFHPDQFVVLNSPHAQVVASSIAELEYQAEVAEWIGADVITIHGGGAYGDKHAALKRLRCNLTRLSKTARSRISLENDDRVFTPADLLSVCESEGVPFVYDVHHHRCMPDTLSPLEATRRALATWKGEPLFHISSPANGWRHGDPRIHGEYIRAGDFPVQWSSLALTVEVEARAKEIAVLRLQRTLARPSLTHKARPSVPTAAKRIRLARGLSLWEARK